MSEVPDSIDLRRDRDLGPRENDIWIRRGLFALICLVPVLALFNLFGQRSQRSAGAVSAAVLSLSAPSRVRGGLIYQAPFTITAPQALHQAALALAPGWVHDLTINTMAPSPVSESSVDGGLGLDLGPISRGQSHVLYISFQMNPTTVGRRNRDVTLYDGRRALITLHRTITVFP